MKKLAFIAGAHRSGTTLVRNVLGNHPRIAITTELRFFDGILSYRLHPRGLNELRRRIASRAAFRVEDRRGEEGMQAFLRALESAGGTCELFSVMAEYTADKDECDLILEKTPANALHIPQMRTLFPDAPIIFVLRDGRDVCASAIQKWGKRRNINLLSVAALWVLTVREYERHLKHTPHLLVRYEDLTRKPDETLKEVFSFLGFRYDSVYRERVPSTSSFRNATLEAVGVHTSSHYRTYFSREWREVIEYVLRPALEASGYTDFEFERYSVSLKVRIRFWGYYARHVVGLWLRRRGVIWLVPRRLRQ